MSNKSQKVPKNAKLMLKSVNRQKMFHKGGISYYWCYYPHTPVSPICEIIIFYWVFHSVMLSHRLKEMQNLDLLSDSDDDDRNYDNSAGKVDHNENKYHNEDQCMAQQPNNLKFVQMVKHHFQDDFL